MRFLPLSFRRVGLPVIVLAFIWFCFNTRFSTRASGYGFDIAELHDLHDSATVRSRCRDYGWKPFRSGGGQPRKVYDLFQINTELDLLEIRLNSTWDQVDYFVIIESDRTFTNLSKPLFLHNSWDRFRAYHSKIIYHQLEFPGDFHPLRPWDYEDFQRNSLLEQVFPHLKGAQTPTEGDVIIAGDVDEIPRPSTLALLKQCDFPRRVTLSSKFFYYGFEFLHNRGEWPFPHATYYVPPGRYKSTILPANLRNSDGALKPMVWYESALIRNAAWHCSSCFSTITEFRNKLSSISHVGMNDDWFRVPEHIADAVRNGRDLWNREGETFTILEDSRDCPSFLAQQAAIGRFRYLVDRTGEDAGFTDFLAWRRKAVEGEIMPDTVLEEDSR